MNKEEAILKIRKMGKVGAIICTVCQVIVTIGFIMAVIGLVVLLCLPKDMLSIETTTRAKVSVNISKFIDGYSAQDLEKLKNDIEKENNDASISINGRELKNETITFDNNTIVVDTSDDVFTFSLKNLIPVLVTAILYIAMLYVALLFARRICKGFKDCESPFEDGIIKNIQYLAYSLIPMMFISTITDVFCEVMVNGSHTTNFTINLTSILTVLIILAVAYIFKYGAKLQQESDETL